jgi:hypothetical protein
MKRALLLLVVLLASCDSRPGWDGWLYPDKTDRDHHPHIGRFATFESCKAAATARIRQLATPEEGGFLCAFNCRWSDRAQSEVCDEERSER